MSFLRKSLLISLLLVFPSCGAGIFGAIFGSSQSGSDSSTPPPVQGPSVQVTPNAEPFARIGEGFQVQVTLRNYRLPESLDPTKFDAAELEEKQRRDELLKLDPDLVWLYKAEDGPRNLRVRIDGGKLASGIQKYYRSFGYQDYEDETFAPQEVLFTFVEGSDTRLVVDIKPTPFLFALLDANPGALQDLTLPLSVVVDGQLLGGTTIPFTFYAPPGLTYTGPVPARIAVDGRSQLDVQVSGLVDPDPKAAEAYVLVRDYDQPLKVVKNAKQVDNPQAFRWVLADMQIVGSLKQVGDKYEGLFRIRLPANRFPGPAQLAVQGKQAGANLLQRIQLLYEPVLQSGGTGPGKITGGTVGDSFLLGRGLIPGKHEGGAAALDFDKVELEIEKAGQTTRVPGTRFEQFSNESHIFYVLPPAPDGLAGQAKITLIQKIGTTEIRKSLLGGVRYAVSTPVLGPLVHALSGSPIRLEGGLFMTRNANAPDLALASVVGTALLGEVQLLRNAGFGLYRNTGRSERTLLPGHQIFDLSSIARFRKDGRDHVYIGGDLSLGPRAGRVLSTGSAATPFQFEANQGFLGVNGVRKLVSGQLNADGVEDLVALERDPLGQKADQKVRLWLTGLTSQGTSRLLDTPKDIAGTAVQVADLDGDGDQDVIVVSEENATVQFAYGQGNGSFDLARSGSVSFLGADLLKKDVLRVMELLVLAQPGAPGAAKDLVVVVETTKGIGLVPMPFDTKARAPSAPKKGASLFHAPAGFVGVDVASMDVGGDVREEVLILLESGEGKGRIDSFEFQLNKTPSFVPKSWVQVTDFNLPVSMQKLRLGAAVGKDLSGEGLLVLHREDLDGKSEPVLSVYPRRSAGLVSPQTGIQTDLPPGAVLAGSFDSAHKSLVPEVLSISPVVSRPTLYEIIRHENLGVGLFKRDLASRTTIANALSVTAVTAARSSKGDYVCLLTQDGKLVVRSPDAKPFQNSMDLSAWMGTSWGGLSAQSRILVGDGDKDGTADLVLVLVPATAGPNVSHLVFLRGDPQHPTNKVPFLAPTAAKQVEIFTGRARQSATLDLLGSSRSGPALEVGLGTASFVGLYTLTQQSPASGANPYAFSLVPLADFAQVLGFKTSTFRVHFADLLHAGKPTGYDDMISVTGRSLDLSFNPKRKSATGRQFKVDVSLASPLSDSEVLSIQTVDMNGDGLRDILVTGIIQSGGKPTNLFVLYRNLGGGSYDNAYVYPVFLFGKAETTFAVADFNGNGMHDVQLGPRTLFSR